MRYRYYTSASVHAGLVHVNFCLAQDCMVQCFLIGAPAFFMRMPKVKKRFGSLLRIPPHGVASVLQYSVVTFHLSILLKRKAVYYKRLTSRSANTSGSFKDRDKHLVGLTVSSDCFCKSTLRTRTLHVSESN